MITGIKFSLNSSLYSRDPQNTELGQRILKHSIILIDEIGLENFTFKKLAFEIESTEASMYRYFENKHQLLLFLTSWYWQWVQYLISIHTLNVEDPKRRLQIIIKSIINATSENALTEYINENLLHNIIINEGSKAYHTHDVDEENKHGIFSSYKELAEVIAQAILGINPKFPYPHSLASNMLEMANNQVYFAQHLPKLTNIKVPKGDLSQLETMMKYFVMKLVK
ncbi:MAG: TetR family transcriptional regulator [Saprospirales bacterium]|nr:TetR family transcriptional regulator [Saprospirales bacterium]HAI57081.1 TetR family transcriptional regulator [Saprospirales bacterium]